MRKKISMLLCLLFIIPNLIIMAEARSFGKWETKFGFAGKVGSAAYLDDGAVMEGFGGAWYSKPVKKQAGIKFCLHKKVNKYNFIVALMNKPNVGWNLNGKESQGIVLQIRSWSNEEGIVADVFKVTGKGERGVEKIGQLNSRIAPMNTNHFVAFYKNSDKWTIALDGGQIVECDQSDFGDNEMYVAAGATYNENDDYAKAMDLKMSVQAVYTDDEMPSAYYGDGDMAGVPKEPVVSGWQRVRGYGKNGADNGKELSVSGGKLIMEGYGGCAYLEKAIRNEAAVDFELNEFDVKKSYYFSFGLVNKKGVYYNPNGSESQGITVRITSFYNELGMSVDIWYVSKAGTENLGTIRTTVPSRNMKHNLAIFKEEGKWYVGIDGEQKLSVDVDVELDGESFLCAGASSYKELKMSVLKVYSDGQLTDKMKGGTLKKSTVSADSGGVKYGPGGTSFSMNELKKTYSDNCEKSYNRFFALVSEIKWYQWILITAILTGITASVIFAVKERKNRR